MASRICIAIAVSKPEGLDELPGAIPSASRLAAWARSQGYDSELVTDQDEAVTCQRLNEVFRRKLGAGGQQRILVSFAGHGLIRGGAEEYWLLNDWRTRATEAVNHIKLRDRLGTYLPRQIAVISDACRSLPTERAKWVEGNGVVDVKDYVEQTPQVANLSGTKAAQPSYATPLGVEEAFCFFTEVLVNALTGSLENAVTIDAAGERVVTNESLYNVVEAELPVLASRHNRRQIPDLQGSWRTPPGSVWSKLGLPTSGPAPRPFDPGSGLRVAIDARGSASAPPQELGDKRASEYVEKLRSLDRATHFETSTGLVFSNAKQQPQISSVVISPHFRAIRDQVPNWFRVEPDEGKSATFVAEMGDGSWVGGVAYRGFINTYSVSDDGADSAVLRPAYTNAPGAEFVVARAATGNLLGDPFELAAYLRDQKHTDPTLGALAAYAYARAGAVEEIRRLCYFYAKYSQPVPFDAVLLARVPVHRDKDGLSCDIPAVAARAPTNDAERARGFTYEATPAASVAVGGTFPWLRQGWALLEDDFRRDFRKIAALAAGLRPGMFTSFKPETGIEVARRIEAGDL